MCIVPVDIILVKDFMVVAREVPLFTVMEDGEESPTVVAPNGVPKLNDDGVEIANILRNEKDQPFNFAQPVEVLGIEDGKYVLGVGHHTRIRIDPENDDYFLLNSAR
jgi:hypothetical protein